MRVLGCFGRLSGELFVLSWVCGVQTVPVLEGFAELTEAAAVVEVNLFVLKIKIQPTGSGKESSIAVFGWITVVSLNLGDLHHPGDLCVQLGSSFIRKQPLQLLRIRGVPLRSSEQWGGVPAPVVVTFWRRGRGAPSSSASRGEAPRGRGLLLWPNSRWLSGTALGLPGEGCVLLRVPGSLRGPRLLRLRSRERRSELLRVQRVGAGWVTPGAALHMPAVPSCSLAGWSLQVPLRLRIASLRPASGTKIMSIYNNCKNWLDDFQASGSQCCAPASRCATNLSDPATHGSKPTCAVGTPAYIPA